MKKKSAAGDEAIRRQGTRKKPAPKTAIRMAGRAASNPPVGDDRAVHADFEPRKVGVPSVVVAAATRAGLGSVLEFAKSLPLRTGAAFVLFVPDGGDVSAIEAELAKATALPIRRADLRVELAADCLFVAVGTNGLALEDGSLVRKGPLARPVDAFLRNVAAAAGATTIAVILSGVGTDGALGLQAVKAEGGACFAEDEAGAEPSEMPRAAIASGSVDAVFGRRALGAEVARVVHEMRALAFGDPGLDSAGPRADEEDLKRLFAIVSTARAVDFTHYRPTTIRRRVERRMMLYKMHSLGEYVRYLAERPAEIEALYQDVLIKVTHFFRDPAMFEALATRVFPPMLRNRDRGEPLRVWVAGCATGEEPYSIAIVLLELLAESRMSIPIQIFATDVNDSAIDRARSGSYLENISLDVSPERLARYFIKDGGRYQVRKGVRDLCVFAKQNVTSDPPFSKLDLITCRNVLIYLEPVLQKKVIPMFHYALRAEGRLVLGTSESIGGWSDLFSLTDKHLKIYAKMVGSTRTSLELSAGRHAMDRIGARASRAIEAPLGSVEVQREADRLVMARYAPPGVIVTADFHILQFRGQTGNYLEPAAGEPTLHLLKMARDGLMLDLRASIERAKKTDRPVRKEGVRVRTEGGYRDVKIEVIPLRDSRVDGAASPQRCYLVLFEEPSVNSVIAPSAPAPRTLASKAHRVRLLEEELLAARSYLQAIIEEQEATNEELQSANEEVLSSNEELQSINEELETAKEELQSTNEELTTLNEELERRNGDLSLVNTDLVNLLASVNIAIVMLSRDLRIRRFTPLAEKVFSLIPSDIGRPLSDIKFRFEAPELEEMIRATIEHGASQDRDVEDRDGHRYSLRVRPYLTLDRRIEGAVMCLVEVAA